MKRSCAAAALLWLAVALPGASAAASAPGTAAADAAAAKIGEQIYRRGVLQSGEALQAMREGGVPGAKGADAACVNCHRRSGLGSTHQSSGIGISAASNQIPPIAGRYLFERNAGHEEANLPYVDGMRSNRSPYTPATLARVLREGVDADGRTLSNLMPRFAIDDTDLSSLVAYLNTLYPARVPGVTPTVLHFATIVTPDTFADMITQLVTTSRRAAIFSSVPARSSLRAWCRVVSCSDRARAAS